MGGAGADELTGGDGDDRLVGERRRHDSLDALDGPSFTDRLLCGAGIDTTLTDPPGSGRTLTARGSRTRAAVDARPVRPGARRRRRSSASISAVPSGSATSQKSSPSGVMRILRRTMWEKRPASSSASSTSGWTSSTW